MRGVSPPRPEGSLTMPLDLPLINLHRRQTSNIGDITSAPLGYFTLSTDQQLMEISGWGHENAARRQKWLAQFERGRGIILGGGGLMEYEKVRPSFEFVARSGRKAVIWGAGNNSAGNWPSARPSFGQDYSAFGLIGCRDHGYESLGFEWVPCASCMHPGFDAPPAPTRDLLFYGNPGPKGTRRLPKGFAEDQAAWNRSTTIEEVIAALASAETVVTTSYHGAYWATLLGRKVVGVRVTAKFYGFRHAIPLCVLDDWPRYARLARTYPEALEECRAANRAFAAKVADYFA